MLRSRRRTDRLARGSRPSGGRLRRVRIGAIVGVSLISAWLIVGTWAFVFPVQDSPRPVDAIVVLGGKDGGAVTDAALDLARDGVSDRVVLFDSFGGNTRPERLCRTASEITVECFAPTTGDTRGEARAIEAMADAEGWSSVLVVTSTYHVTRARVILDRCLSGGLLMQGVGSRMDAAEWAYQYLYQSAAFVKVLTDPSC